MLNTVTPHSSKASEGAMRKLASASLLAVALLLICAAPSLAGGGRHWHGGGHHWHGGSRVFIGVGPGYWYGGYPYPYPYYYPYAYPYYYTPPPVVIQDPPVYVQQPGQSQTAPPATSAPAEGYWHYCSSARDYYPNVSECPEAWVKVPPRQQ
jgi:hypothetical protein